MAQPRKVSRSGKDSFHGHGWNGFVDLCAMEPLEYLTTVQRKAALAFWYMAEVINGGHFQYFVNKRYYDHSEVAGVLRSLGAVNCAEILTEAMKHYPEGRRGFPVNVEQYVENEENAGLDKFDRLFGERGEREVMKCLEEYLAAHESEFIEWVL
jgi:Domain of unknown function (DUF4375)